MAELPKVNYSVNPGCILQFPTVLDNIVLSFEMRLSVYYISYLESESCWTILNADNMISLKSKFDIN